MRTNWHIEHKVVGFDMHGRPYGMDVGTERRMLKLLFAKMKAGESFPRVEQDGNIFFLGIERCDKFERKPEQIQEWRQPQPA